MNIFLKGCVVLVACIASIAMANTNEVVDQSLQNPKIEQALITTQLLAATICQDKANLNPQALIAESSAFMFIITLYALHADLETKPGLVVERMKQMKCGQGGILQLEAPSA